jgi:hypothetical protein
MFITGEIAHFMLFSSTRYAFLVSTNEIMFLNFDLIEKVEYHTRNGIPVPLYTEPHLSYTRPIKFTDVLDEEEGSVSMKTALLHMLHRGMEDDSQLMEDTWSSLKYTAKTKAGEAYRPRLMNLGLSERS